MGSLTSFLPNVFSDPELRARQDQLDAQWSATWALYQNCDNTPQGAFPEFVNDLSAWRDFYDGESDWSADSKKATDEWQVKLQEWVSRLKSYGCTGSVGSIGGIDIMATGDQGIPGVKDPPPDKPGLWKQIIGGVEDVENAILAPLGKVGIGIGVLLIILLIGAVYVITRGKFEGFGAKIG